MSFRDDLKAYIDGELGDSRRLEIERALQADLELAREAHELRCISSAIRQSAKTAEPVGMEATLRALQPSARHLPRWLVPAMAGAAVAAVAVVAVPSMLGDQVVAEGPVAASPGHPPHQMPVEEAQMLREKAALEWRGGYGAIGGGGANLRARRAEASFNDSNVSEAAKRPGTVIAKNPERLVVRTAQLSITATKVENAQEEAKRIAARLGGFIEQSSMASQTTALGSATISLRVPSSRFDQAIAALKKLGDVTHESIGGSDVTGQVVDLEARLKALRTEETSYLEIMRTAKRVGEVLAVKERLGQVREEIESRDAERKLLRDQAAMSSITLFINERVAVGSPSEIGDGWLHETWANAVNSLARLGRNLGSMLVFCLVFSPVWAPVASVGWWLAKRGRG